MKLVRMYPFDPQRGHHMRRFTLMGSSYPTFLDTGGWYTVDDKTAEYLAAQRNHDGDPTSRPVFQVVTHEEAQALDRAASLEHRKATSPHPLPEAVRAAVKPAPAPVAVKEPRGKSGHVMIDETPKRQTDPYDLADDDDLAEIDALVGMDTSDLKDSNKIPEPGEAEDEPGEAPRPQPREVVNEHASAADPHPLPEGVSEIAPTERKKAAKKKAPARRR